MTLVYRISVGRSGVGGSGDGDSLDAPPPPPHPASSEEISNKEKVANGLLFKKQTSQEIFDTISWFEDKKLWRKFKPEILHEYSQNFSIETFITKIDTSMNKAWERFEKKI